MIGMSCGEHGHLTVTDMDTIEKSNLNRQFLFRSWDVQKSKAEVSTKAAKLMNKNINVSANLNRVGPETESFYDESFYASLDVVCNALDNVKARLYIDSRCIQFKKPLIESGTLGTEGNTQIIIPYLTEAYSSSQDPPEKSIPICTLKIFPNAIEHTLQWARDMFEGLFHNPAVAALNYIKEPNSCIQGLSKLTMQQRLDELEQLEKIFITEKCTSFDECVLWARRSWQQNFSNIIQQLLYNFPADQKTSNGLPFWSGPKRCPHPLQFDVNNSMHFGYVFSAANLKAIMHGIDATASSEQIIDILADAKIDMFQPKTGVRIKVNESDEDDSGDLNDEDEIKIERLTELLVNEATSLTRDVKLIPIEFEKDDDSNHHMDFITCCSNLRAENYDISPTDKHNVIKVFKMTFFSQISMKLFISNHVKLINRNFFIYFKYMTIIK